MTMNNLVLNHCVPFSADFIFVSLPFTCTSNGLKICERRLEIGAENNL